MENEKIRDWKSIRQISNRKNVIKIVVGIAFISLTVFLSINQSMNEAQLMTTLVMIVFFLAAFLSIEIWGMINEIHFLDDYMELVFSDLLDSKR